MNHFFTPFVHRKVQWKTIKHIYRVIKNFLNFDKRLSRSLYIKLTKSVIFSVYRQLVDGAVTRVLFSGNAVCWFDLSPTNKKWFSISMNPMILFKLRIGLLYRILPFAIDVLTRNLWGCSKVCYIIPRTNSLTMHSPGQALVHKSPDAHSLCNYVIFLVEN